MANRKVKLALRLRLFDAIVTPNVFYGLATVPLTKASIFRLDVAQRRMLRSLIGWVSVYKDDWPGTMRRMRLRMDAALSAYPVPSWSHQAFRRRWSLAHRFANMSAHEWPAQAAAWRPDLTRNGWSATSQEETGSAA